MDLSDATKASVEAQASNIDVAVRDVQNNLENERYILTKEGGYILTRAVVGFSLKEKSVPKEPNAPLPHAFRDTEEKPNYE